MVLVAIPQQNDLRDNRSENRSERDSACNIKCVARIRFSEEQEQFKKNWSTEQQILAVNSQTVTTSNSFLLLHTALLFVADRDATQVCDAM